MTAEERAHNIMVTNRYLNLGTCSDGLPWVAALAYSLTSELDLIFYSAVSSRHIEQLDNCDLVSLNIYDSSLGSDDVDGLQATASCEMVDDAELATLVPDYYQFSFPDSVVRSRWERDPAAFKGQVLQKFFRLSLKELYVIDLENTEVDGRTLVDLNKVKAIHQGA